MSPPDTTRREPSRATWIAAGATLLGAASLLLRRGPATRPAADARYDESTGRGRAAQPASPAARSAGHETQDLRGGALGKLLLLLGSVAFCMVFAMIGLRIWVTNVQRGAEPPLTAIQRTIPTPPEPHLQRDPLRQIANLHADEDRLLDNYAYLGGDRTRARIPIDRAMALTVGQPLAPPP